MASSPLAFKGIALFTPGGDVVYCIDPHKQIRWHIHLCGALQHLLGLSELPHFLVPCYTATVDRSVDSVTQQVFQVAEASPLVIRYQSLLNTMFDTPNLVWQQTQLRSTVCDPIVLATYRSQFPQLWESHDLVVRYEQTASALQFSQPSPSVTPSKPTRVDPQGYVLRLFVSGHSSATQRTLQKLHTLLEQTLDQPYTLKVIDVAQHPEQAEQDQITATPTLVRAYPPPMLRIVGSLENVDQLLGLLRVLDE